MLTPVTMHKSEKYHIRRMSSDSRELVMKNFGCRRKVYNLYVDDYFSRLEACGYENGDDIPEYKLPQVSSFKKEYPYLKEVDSLGLANAKIAFESAVKRFQENCDHTSYTKRAVRRSRSGTEVLSFRGLVDMPSFKSKAKGDFSYTTNCQYPNESNQLKQPTIRLNGCMLHLPKYKDDFELDIHRPLPDGAVIGNVTVSMDATGMMYASIEYSYVLMMDITIRDAVMNNNDNGSIMESLSFIGLDYSQPEFYVDSNGRKANCPHFYRKSEEKLARLQRELSRMEQDSKNYNRQKARIQKLHKKIANQRKDFICKEARYLADTYDVVVVEDIDLRAMGQCLSLGKNLYDNGFGMFRNKLAENLEAKGSVLVKVNRWFASTKTCHHCGYVNKDVVLGVGEWICPDCGTHHIRDNNAAVNIRNEGKRIFADYFREWLEQDKQAKDRREVLSKARKNKKN